MNETEIRNGFIRQRRNLFVISLVLVFYGISELSISKINVFGTEVLIRNPVSVTILVWVAYLYFLYRYYVYFHDVGDKGFHVKRRTRLSYMIARWCKKKFDTDSAWRQERVAGVRDQLTTAYPGNTDLHVTLKSSDDWELREAVVVGRDAFREIPVQVGLGVFVMRDGKRAAVNQGHTAFVITGLDAMILNTRASLYVLARTHILTEYFLPYFVAPMLYFLYRLFDKVRL